MDADVIVVGAGPSGLVVANELRVQGCSVLVLERREHGVQSRAGSVLPRVLELFDYRGQSQAFLERARDAGEEPLKPSHIWAGLAPIRWALRGGAFPYSLTVPQSETEKILLATAEQTGVQIRHGQTVTALVQDDAGVTITTASPTGEESTCTARYVVGADGGRSAVRSLAGIGFPGRDATFTGMIADVRGEMRWPGGRGIASNEHGWAMAFPFTEGGTVTRFNIVHAERRTADVKEPVTLAEIRRCAEEIFERELDIDEIGWASRFGDTMRQADRLREGRVLLVGESARIHYPASGVGMNGQKVSRSRTTVETRSPSMPATATSRWCGASHASGRVHTCTARPARPLRYVRCSAMSRPGRRCRRRSQLRDVTATSPPSASTAAIAASAERRPADPTACVSELPTHSTASNGPAMTSGRSSQAQTTAATSTPWRSASTRVRPTIPGLASEATTSNPRRASPTASWPVPAAQSNTRPPEGMRSTTASNAATAPSGSISASGTSQS